MSTFLALAAYAKVQGLTNAECEELGRSLYEVIPPVDAFDLDRVDEAILEIKRQRRPAPMPPARTHQEWREARRQTNS